MIINLVKILGQILLTIHILTCAWMAISMNSEYFYVEEFFNYKVKIHQMNSDFEFYLLNGSKSVEKYELHQKEDKIILDF